MMKKRKQQADQPLRTQSRDAHSDILGSYTGTPAEGEEPTQDADDL